MTTITKVGAVTFSHSESYNGEVEIERGGLAVSVPFETLQVLIADKVRHQMMLELENLKPHEILGLAASKAKK